VNTAFPDGQSVGNRHYWSFFFFDLRNRDKPF
jgi:hypothetical protein